MSRGSLKSGLLVALSVLVALGAFYLSQSTSGPDPREGSDSGEPSQQAQPQQQGQSSQSDQSDHTEQSEPSMGSSVDVAATASDYAGGTIAVSDLPVQAREVIELIQSGGPFPYDRDGITFGNFEGHLPDRDRGYYREYTVPTPGVDHRGARRIVTGSGGEYYYTEDHYDSFREVVS